MSRVLAFFRTAYGVMAVVVVQYVLKVAVKGGFGLLTGSPAFTGDGAHNASDVFQAVLVIAGIWLSKRPPSREYPLGLRKLETVMVLLIGLSLAYVTAFNVLWPSICGLFASFDQAAGTEGASHVLSGGYGGWAVAIMVVSAIVSGFVGRYQIRVGKATGHASVVADGEETISDMKVEMVIVLGFCLQTLFAAAWIEYALGLLVAWIMFGTAREILANGRDMLLNRSLGEETEKSVRELAMGFAGVDGIVSLRTHRSGPFSVANVQFVTGLPLAASAIVCESIKARILELLSKDGGEAIVTVHAVPPARVVETWGFLLRETSPRQFEVSNVLDATHLGVAAVTNGTFHSWRPFPITVRNLRWILEEKRVGRLHGLGDPSRENLPSGTLPNGVYAWVAVPTSNLTLLGFPPE